MALQAKYKQYLANPTADALAADAAVNYIPTLSTISQPIAILKHLNVQNQQLKKKDEIFLGVVEGPSSLCVETETTLEFLFGGGTYLPGMDDNLLADKIVTLVIMHVVTFTSEQKIQQIRLLWDQGALLKSIDVIGRTGKNWPLCDGRDQARLVASSAAATPQTTVGGLEQKVPPRHSKADTTLNLFSPRDLSREDSPRNPVVPRESAKPPPREYGELFAAGGEPISDRSPSPTKTSDIKIGAGKHFQHNRLFEQGPDPNMAHGKLSVKTNPSKYNHFEFGDAPPAQPVSTRANIHAAQWDFADFATPQKHVVRTQTHTLRHFGLGDEEGDVIPSPSDRHVVKPRPDTAPNFGFNENTPKGDKASESNLNAHPRTAVLYEDHILGNKPQENGGDEPTGRVLGNITNINSHLKTFESSWDVPQKGDLRDENLSVGNLPESRKQAVKAMEAGWQMFPDSPQQQRGIKIAGNGMGSRLEGSNWWEY